MSSLKTKSRTAPKSHHIDRHADAIAERAAPGQPDDLLSTTAMSSLKTKTQVPVTAADSSRLISKAEVLARVGVTFPTVWAWMRAGKFPRSREIGSKAMWLESEISEWIAGLPERKYKGDDQRRRAGQGR
jgi:predicted DNA-binding transcriptional regulator AlpA